MFFHDTLSATLSMQTGKTLQTDCYVVVPRHLCLALFVEFPFHRRLLGDAATGETAAAQAEGEET